MDAKNVERIAKILSFELKDAEIAAKEIGDRYVDVYSLAVADSDELSRIEHVGDKGAHLLRLVMSLRSRSGVDSFKLGRKHTEEEIVDFLKSLFKATNLDKFCPYGKINSCGYKQEYKDVARHRVVNYTDYFL